MKCEKCGRTMTHFHGDQSQFFCRVCDKEEFKREAQKRGLSVVERPYPDGSMGIEVKTYIKEYDFKREMENSTVNLARKITDNVQKTNLLFAACSQGILLREDVPSLFVELAIPCKDEIDFSRKIQCLANLFEVGFEPLKRLVPNFNGPGGVPYLLEAWIYRDEDTENKYIFHVWRAIVCLRNAPPTHSRFRTKDYHWALELFGVGFPINYEKLWDQILFHFNQSLIELQEHMNEILSQKRGYHIE